MAAINKKQLAMTVFIVFIMVFSIAGFVLNFNLDQSGQEIAYKNYKFKRLQNGVLLTKINGQEIPFTYFPTEVTGENDTALPNGTLSRLRGKTMVFITYNPNESQADIMGSVAYDVEKALTGHYRVFVQPSFTIQTQYPLPAVTCANSTAYAPVLMLMQSNATQIISKGSCIIASAENEQEFVRIRDRLLYGILGVTE